MSLADITLRGLGVVLLVVAAVFLEGQATLSRVSSQRQRPSSVIGVL